MNYVPTTKAAFNTWINNFAAYVAINFAALGLSSADNDLIQDAVNQSDAAYTLSVNADTRTPATVADAQTKANYCRTVLQQFSQIVNNSPATSDLQRAALQITIRATGRTPIPAPLSYPVLTNVNATPLNHKLSYQDSEAILTKVKARPFGAAALELRMHAGATPPATPEDAAFVGLYTRTPFYVEQDPANVGHTAYYYARWVTGRGLAGPWSAMSSMTITA